MLYSTCNVLAVFVSGLMMAVFHRQGHLHHLSLGDETHINQ